MQYKNVGVKPLTENDIPTISFEDHEKIQELISRFSKKVLDKTYSADYNDDIEGAFRAALAEELKECSQKYPTSLHPDGHYKVCHNCDTVLERKDARYQGNN